MDDRVVLLTMRAGRTATTMAVEQTAWDALVRIVEEMEESEQSEQLRRAMDLRKGCLLNVDINQQQIAASLTQEAAASKQEALKQLISSCNDSAREVQRLGGLLGRQLWLVPLSCSLEQAHRASASSDSMRNAARNATRKVSQKGKKRKSKKNEPDVGADQAAAELFGEGETISISQLHNFTGRLLRMVLFDEAIRDELSSQLLDLEASSLSSANRYKAIASKAYCALNETTQT